MAAVSRMSADERPTRSRWSPARGPAFAGPGGESSRRHTDDGDDRLARACCDGGETDQARRLGIAGRIQVGLDDLAPCPVAGIADGDGWAVSPRAMSPATTSVFAWVSVFCSHQLADDEFRTVAPCSPPLDRCAGGRSTLKSRTVTLMTAQADGSFRGGASAEWPRRRRDGLVGLKLLAPFLRRLLPGVILRADALPYQGMTSPARTSASGGQYFG